MLLKDARVENLKRLLAEDRGPERGRKARLAKRIGKSPAQISQWLSGYRSIEEGTAREIERKTRKPPFWLDSVGGKVVAGGRPIDQTPHELTSLAVKLAQRLDELADDAEHHRTAYVMAREAIDRAAAAVADLRDAERATPPRAAPRKQLRRRA